MQNKILNYVLLANEDEYLLKLKCFSLSHLITYGFINFYC